MAGSAFVFEATAATFPTAVMERSKDVPVVVDFWAEWCNPCMTLKPILTKAVEARGGAVVLATVNVDEEQQLARQFRVQSIPLVLGIRGGQVVDGFQGMVPEHAIAEFLDRLLPSEAEKVARQAAELEQTDPAAAERLYRDALARQANQDAARIGLARLLLAAGKTEEVPGLLEPVGTGGDLGSEAEKLLALLKLAELAKPLGTEAAARDRLAREPTAAVRKYELGVVLAAAGRYAEALPLLLEAGEADPRLASTQVREAMVHVFHAVGEGDPLANEYRGKLATLLF